MDWRYEITIKQVDNGYIVTFDSFSGISTEVYEKFDDAIKEICRFFREDQ
jgi:hypothetical protein